MKKLKLGRSSSPRAAMLDNMVTSLFKHERIRTTDKKAKAAKALAERLLSYAREGSLASRRLAGRTVRDARVLKKLFEELGPRMKDRPSGAVVVTKLWPRHGDGALLAMMELHGAKIKVKAAKGEKGAPKQPTDSAQGKGQEKKAEGRKAEKTPKKEKKEEPRAKSGEDKVSKKEAPEKK
jgi:large subunit ribosomal protein L17